MRERESGRASNSFATPLYLKTALLVAASITAQSCSHMPTAVSDACKTAALVDKDALLSVPFEVIDGRIYVQARVNGRGPYTFAVDTGASDMGRADASLTSALGLDVSRKTETSDGVSTATVDLTHFDSLELGGFERKDLDVITRDYSSRMSPKSAFSGIIAREFFADGLLVIDWPSRTLSFSRSHALVRGDKGVLGYERPFRVPVSIGAVQTEGNLDTGANVTFVMPKTLFDKVGGSALDKAEGGTLTNTKIETQRATVHGPFRVGNMSASNVEVKVSDRFPELLVGAYFLQNSVLLIDQRSKSVALCSSARPG